MECWPPCEDSISYVWSFLPPLKYNYCLFNFCPPFQHFLLFSLFLHAVIFTSIFSFQRWKILSPFFSSCFTLQVLIKKKCKRNFKIHWCHILFLVDFIREELERLCEVLCCLTAGLSPVWVCDAGCAHVSAFNGKDQVGKMAYNNLIIPHYLNLFFNN